MLLLTPTQFIHKFHSGRTKPFLVEGVDQEGNLHEVVLKLRGREYGYSQQACELIAGQLALWLGIATPRVAVVSLSPDFAQVIPVEYRQAFIESIGHNFGSLFIGPGASVWPQGMQVKKSEQNAATAIYAFDALVQNPDRQADNPNLLVKDGTFYAIDNEPAFSPLVVPIVGASYHPWEREFLGIASSFAAKHVFYHQLKSRIVDIEQFARRLQSLDGAIIDGWIESIPLSWIKNSVLPSRIAAYLKASSKHSNEFQNIVEYLLK